MSHVPERALALQLDHRISWMVCDNQSGLLLQAARVAPLPFFSPASSICRSADATALPPDRLRRTLKTMLEERKDRQRAPRTVISRQGAPHAMPPLMELTWIRRRGAAAPHVGNLGNKPGCLLVLRNGTGSSRGPLRSVLHGKRPTH